MIDNPWWSHALGWWIGKSRLPSAIPVHQSAWSRHQHHMKQAAVREQEPQKQGKPQHISVKEALKMAQDSRGMFTFVVWWGGNTP